jgi:RND superfamily putative drug exporter
VATLLYRLGRFSYRRAALVITVWALALAAALGVGLGLGGQTDESFSIPGTESQEALDQLDQLFPQVAATTVQAVVAPDDGSLVTDTDIRGEIASLVDDLRALDGVENVLGPYDEFADNQVSDDESTAIVQVSLVGNSQTISTETLDAVTATAEARDVRVEFAGQVFQDSTVGITVIEVVGVLVAGAVLVVTFGSLLSAGMPLLVALLGIGITIGGILAVAALVPVSSSAPLLALMIGLAVGIDYSLFILSRHRTQLARGETPQESAGVAVGTAGSAVVFAGVTVIIALLGLLVVGVPFLSVMGIGAAVAVTVAMLGATTLLPALMGVAGARLVPREGSRAWRRAHPTSSSRPTMGRRWVRGVMRRPILTTVGVVVVLGTISIPTFSLDLNLPDGGQEPEGSTQRIAYDLIAESFGPGTAGPLLVTVDITQTTAILEDLEAIGDELAAVPGVASVSQGIPSPGLELAIFRVAPTTAPDAQETKQLVAELREVGQAIETEYGTPLAITGVTAVGIDISTRLTNALVPFGLIVVGLSILLLMAVFRSVLVPVKAALGFLLTVGSAIGVTVAVFQWGWGAELLHAEPGPILSFMPIILMAVLFGLAMDYEVFLVSGMREEHVHGASPREAIEEGFTTGARVVTAAALIMFFVFAAFVPEGAGLIKPIALGLAVGIAVDAFVVRMLLGPALMTLFGRYGWWFPRVLDRLLPDLDVEGARLRLHRETAHWASEAGDAVVVADRLQITGTDSSLTFRVGAGERVVIDAAGAERGLVLATLAGYLAAPSGRARVAGALLPSESATASTRVSLLELQPSRLDPAMTVRQLVTEHRVHVPGSSSRRGVDTWWRRAVATARAVGHGAEGLASVALDDTLSSLEPARRALALVAAASASGASVYLFDTGSLASQTVEAVDALVQKLGSPHSARVFTGDAVSTDAAAVALDPYDVTDPDTQSHATEALHS